MHLFSALDLENVSNAKSDHMEWVWSRSAASDNVLTVLHSRGLGFTGNQWSLMFTMFFSYHDVAWHIQELAWARNLDIIACCHLHGRINANGIARDARLTDIGDKWGSTTMIKAALRILHHISPFVFCAVLWVANHCNKSCANSNIVRKLQLYSDWGKTEKSIADCIVIAWM